MNRHLGKSVAAAAFLTSALVAGCSGPPGPPQMPPPQVGVTTLAPRAVPLTSELPGRTSSIRVAEIRPQVSGLLQSRKFTEGADVKAGEVLYQIDPDPYQAAYDSAIASLAVAREGADRAKAALGASRASLKRHEAILKLAKANLRRYESLVTTQAASVMQRDQAAADVDVADSGLRAARAQVESDTEAVAVALATIKQAEAAVETARINLGYTKIRAPISGRIGRSSVTEGAIVTAYQPLALATIQQLDPIYVDVPQSTVALNQLKRSLANGRLKKSDVNRAEIVLEDGTKYSEEGSLQFRDVTVDPTTGSVILRITVPNPKGILLPGMFVRAIIHEGIDKEAMLVPQQAVLRDPKGNPYVMVVQTVKDEKTGKDMNVVTERRITTERALGDQWLVSSGVSAGDRVVMEGIQMVQQFQRMLKSPTVPVTPVPFAPDQAKSAGAQPVSPAQPVAAANPGKPEKQPPATAASK